MEFLLGWFERARLNKLFQIISLPVLLALPVAGNGDNLPLTTRDQTVRPLALPSDTPPVLPKEVALYESYGYSAWQFGPGADEGQKINLMRAGYTGAVNRARLLSFFSMTDVHLTDKESPAQVPFAGWNANFHDPGQGDLNSSAYSPIILSTTHVLDAAVKTINALHQQTRFDFGICLGDVCNASQYNELRWFIDVMDGKSITPSSGAHLGADTIGYQKPYQAAGLDRSIPWYQVIGNHDQFWMGTANPTAKIRNILTNTAVLNMGVNPLAADASESNGMYVGVVDGSTPYGDVIKAGPTNLFVAPPTVVADPDRHTITPVDVSSPTNFINEFFKSTSQPLGHGFSGTITGTTAACYSFMPRADLPLKVIVLDDTCKSSTDKGGPKYYGGGWVDAARYAWLTNELWLGQVSTQLMIVACHIPILPQRDLFNPLILTNAMFYVTNLTQSAGCQTEASMIDTLHQYPNVILLMAGHAHRNVVTPQPSPDPTHPEYGFWEVETPSLRDFPQQFRTWEILRNTDNTISIKTTDVDPVVEEGTPAWDSRGYAIGAARIYGKMTNTDITSHTYNVELVKQLTTNMQAKIAGLGVLLPQIVAPPVVTNSLLQLDAPAIVVGGELTGFTVGAEGALQYQWSFGDGVTSGWTNLSTATHTYAAATCTGYTATVSVKNDQGTITSNLAVIVACDLTTANVNLGVNFAKSNADSIKLTAQLVLPGITNIKQLVGKPVVLDVGDAQVPFTLKGGRLVSPAGTCQLTYAKPTKTWTATIALNKGAWRSQWNKYGLYNATLKSPVTVPVVLLVGTEAFATEAQLKYTATRNKTGTAK